MNSSNNIAVTLLVNVVRTKLRTNGKRLMRLRARDAKQTGIACKSRRRKFLFIGNSQPFPIVLYFVSSLSIRAFWAQKAPKTPGTGQNQS